MHQTSQKEIDYFRKVDRRNGKNVDYSFPDRRDDNAQNDIHQTISSVALRSDDIKFGGNVTKEKRKRYTSDDFKITMNSSVTPEISSSLQAITSNRFDYRDYGGKDNTQRLASVLLRKGNDLSKLSALEDDRMPSSSQLKQSASFNSGGFVHNPFSKQKPKKTKKRVFTEISDLPKPKSKSEPIESADIRKLPVPNSNTNNIFGVAFCDCNCTGCHLHDTPLSSSSSSSTSSGIDSAINENSICHYRSKESKIEYMIKDNRWTTNEIDHIQVVDSILESIQIVETSRPLYENRVNIQHMLEILDASNITPVSISIFCRRVSVIGGNTSPFCFSTAQDDVFNYQNDLMNDDSTAHPDEIQRSAIKKIEEKYQMVYQSLNKRVCLHSSHNKKISGNVLKDQKHRQLCAVIESRSTIDPRILIRSCFIFQDDSMTTMLINEEDFAKAAAESVQYHQKNSATDLSDVSTSYMSMISNIYRGNYNDKVKNNPESLQTLIRVIVEFTGYNNSDVTVMRGIDSDMLSFHKLDTLETTQKPIGILWNMLKQIEIWRYCRTFALILPSI